MGSASDIERSQTITGSASSAETDRPNFAVKHYSVAEIASAWGLSDDAVRKIFGKEPGVLKVCGQNLSSRKRRYTTLRIPEYVAERVHRRLTRGVDSAPC
jgi:hypothetical protein